MPLITRDRLQLLAQPGTWSALAQAAAWRAAGPCEPAATAAPVERLGIRWPAAYQHPNAEPFVRPLLRGFRELADVSIAPIPQPFEGIVLIEIEAGGEAHPVAIDYFDYTFVNGEAAKNVAVYFKYQHLKDGYPYANVVPGGYIQPRAFLYDHACRLRVLRSRGEREDVYGRFSMRF